MKQKVIERIGEGPNRKGRNQVGKKGKGKKARE